MKKKDIFRLDQEDQVSESDSLAEKLRDMRRTSIAVQQETKITYNRFSDLITRLKQDTSLDIQKTPSFKQALLLIKSFQNELQGYKDIAQKVTDLSTDSNHDPEEEIELN